MTRSNNEPPAYNRRKALKKRYTKRSRLLQEKNATASILNRVVSEVGKSGIKVAPSAQDQLTRILLRARMNGTLSTNKEAVIGASALIMAGAQVSKGSQVTVGDLEIAWMSFLRRCPGNLPPPKCIRRSVLLNIDALREGLPGFAKVIDGIQEID